MGQVIETIKRILACPHVCGSTNSIINIDEDNNIDLNDNFKLKKVRLIDVKNDMLVIHPDKAVKVKIANKNVSCISPLNSIAGHIQHNRACDAVLIRERPDFKCSLVFIELKSLYPDGASTQIKSTVCFFDYVRSVLAKFYGIDADFEDQRFIVFHTSRRPRNGEKRPTRPTNRYLANTDFSNPAKCIVSNNESIPVSRLTQ